MSTYSHIVKFFILALLVAPITSAAFFSGGFTPNGPGVTLDPPVVSPPVVSIGASKTTITAGEAVSVSWLSSGAHTCSGVGSGLSGSVTVRPTRNTTYTVSCTGSGGTRSDSVTVNVQAAPQVVAPQASISASSSSIVRGSRIILSWSSTNASSCTGLGLNTSNRTSGSVSVYPTSTRNYTVTCTGDGGSASDSVRVTVSTPPAAPTVSFSASPTSILQGQYSTLSWSSTNATSCTGSGFNTSNRTSGSVSVSPNNTTNYSITCYGNGGTASGSRQVAVTAPTVGSCTPGHSQNVLMTSFNTNNEASNIFSRVSINRVYAPGEDVYASGSIWSDDYPRACPRLSVNGVSFNLGCTLQMGPSASKKVMTAPTTPGIYQVGWAISNASGYRLNRICPVTFTVTAPSPTAALSASPTSITRGDTTRLSWSSTNASSCTGSGFNTSNRTSGSVTVSPTSSTNYSVTCTGSGGSANDSASVAVNTPTPAPTVSFSASPTSILQGQYSTLSWSSTNATSCTGSGFNTSNRTSGSVSVSPNNTTNYSITCYGNGGTASGSRQVAVTAPTVGSCRPGSTQSVSMRTFNTNNEASSIFSRVRINSSYAPGEDIYAFGSVWSDDYPRACPRLSVNGISFNLGCRLQMAPGATKKVMTAPTTPGNYQIWWAISGTSGYNVDRICPVTFTVTAPSPTAALSASPTSITRGDTTRLSWSSTNASSCTGSGFNTSNRTSGSVTVSPTSSTNYSVTCTGAGGNASDSARVTVSAPPTAPTAALSALQTSITRGDTTRLSWNSTNATSCTGSGFNTSNRTSGSVSVAPTGSTNYSVTCTGAGGNANDSTRVTVSAPAPIARLSASETSITRGDTTRISWSSANASSCAGSGFNTNKRTFGSVTVSPENTTDYSVTCYGSGGNASDSERVTVSAPPTAPTAALSASPTSITRGDSSTLSWSSTGATRCISSSFNTSNRTSGSVSVSPNSTTRYYVSCIDDRSGQYTTAGASVTVNLPTPAPTAALSASPTSITRGDTTRISWSSTNASSCTGSGFNTSNRTSGSVTVSPTSSTNYSVTCYGDGGIAGDSAAVTVSTPTPTTALSASPTSITRGDSSTLSWSSTGATRCVSSSFNTSNRTSGSVSVSPNGTTRYYVSCIDDRSGKYKTAGATVTVNAPTPAPTAALSASPASITRGDTTRLSWNSTGASSCTGSGFSTSNRISGSVVVSPTSSTNYSVTCTGAGGSANDSASVTVSEPTPAPTATLSASPTSITRGDSSTLSWSSTNATSCTGSGFNTSNRTSGSVAVSPSGSDPYGITCTGAGGLATDFVSIQVINPEASISADDERVKSGDPTRIRWSASDVNSCTVSGPGFSVDEEPSTTPGDLSGNRSVTVSARSTYEIVCEVAVGNPVSDSVEVRVVADFEEF